MFSTALKTKVRASKPIIDVLTCESGVETTALRFLLFLVQFEPKHRSAH